MSEPRDPNLRPPFWEVGVTYRGEWTNEFERQLAQHGIELLGGGGPVEFTPGPLPLRVMGVKLRFRPETRDEAPDEARQRVRKALEAAGVPVIEIGEPHRMT
jgi:hypothetical protein